MSVDGSVPTIRGHLVGALDHVVVGDDRAVRADDEARAGALAGGDEDDAGRDALVELGDVDERAGPAVGGSRGGRALRGGRGVVAVEHAGGGEHGDDDRDRERAEEEVEQVRGA
jgi:hypothetical protein